jgi:NAD(P)H-flavin reductase
VSFDGPLGQNLQLEKYDNVFLAVKGIGIAGVLSYAKHLVELESSLPG